jgi:hypothetical protein
VARCMLGRRSNMRLQPSFLCLAIAALGAMAIPSSASAQTAPTVNLSGPIFRLNSDGSEAAARSQVIETNVVTLDDCLADRMLRFPLALTGISSSFRLEVWAGGQDCSALVARTSNTATCWPVLAGSLQPTANISLEIYARDIIANQGGSAVKPTTYSRATESACYVQSGTGPTTLNVYFLWLDNSNNAAAQKAQAVIADTRGPTPPSSIKVSGGEVVTVDWTPSSDQETNGFVAYCDPPPGQEDVPADESTTVEVCEDTGVGDAGTPDVASGTPSTDASSDAASAAEASFAGERTGTVESAQRVCRDEVIPKTPCTIGTFGVKADSSDVRQRAIDPKYICKTLAGGATNSLQIDGLRKGVKYTIAIAGIDKYENVGPIAEAICGSAEETQDFWELYKQSGGTAASCASIDRVEKRAPTTSLAIVLLALGGAFVFRRRRSA